MPHPRPGGGGKAARGREEKAPPGRQAGFFPAFFIITCEKEGSNFTSLAPITKVWGPATAPASEEELRAAREALGCVSAQGRGAEELRQPEGFRLRAAPRLAPKVSLPSAPRASLLAPRGRAAW